MGSQRGVRQGVSTVTARTTWPCFHAGMSPNHINAKGPYCLQFSHGAAPLSLGEQQPT